MKKKIFIINGSTKGGKDTFVSLVTTELNDINKRFHTVINYDSVGRLKVFEKEINRNVEEANNKTERYRKFLSDLKNLTDEYCDLSFKDICDVVNVFNSDNNEALVLFIHIREPKNIERAVKELAAKTVLVKNKNAKLITSNESDKNIFNYEYNYVINNNGSIDDLRNEVKKFVQEVIL